MNTSPLVSVIIPTFNRANVIANAIESVLSQRYRPLEIIVVDDGSSDNTETVVRHFTSCVRYVRQSNGGPSSARNHGTRISRGEILMFLDSDDVFLPGKLGHQVRLLSVAGPDVPCCIGSAILREEAGRDYVSFEIARLHPKHIDGLWTNPAIVFSTRFLVFNPVASIRREAFIACGGFNESLHAHEDWDLALRLSFGCHWAYTSEPLTVCSLHRKDSLTDMNLKNLVALKECALRFQSGVLDLARTEPDTYPEVTLLLRRKLSNTRRELYAYRLAASSSALPAFLGRCLRWANNARNAITRRFFYPTMKVRPLKLLTNAPEMETDQTMRQNSQ
jgi:glycosyltransferase involved in cell wall biosynthesis